MFSQSKSWIIRYTDDVLQACGVNIIIFIQLKNVKNTLFIFDSFDDKKPKTRLPCSPGLNST